MTPSAGEMLQVTTRSLRKRHEPGGARENLVEHHADLIFDICHQVTVLNLGRTLAAGTPAEIRVHKEVVSAYLGG